MSTRIGLAVFVLAAGVAYGASVTVAVPKEVSGAPGGDATVDVTLRGAQGLGSLQLELTWDPAVLEAKDVQPGPNAPAMLLEHNVTTPGRMRIALAANEPLNGEVQLSATFAVKSAGSCSLGLDKVQAWEHGNGLEMLVTAEPGQFSSAKPADAPPASAPIPWALMVGGAAVLVAVVALLACRGKGRPTPA